MLPPGLAMHTVTVIEPQTADDHGVTVADWAAAPASTTVISGCNVQAVQGTEADDHRDANQTVVDVFMPADAPVTSLSHLTVPGYPPLNVTAEPRRLAFGLPLDHLEVRAQRWEG